MAQAFLVHFSLQDTQALGKTTHLGKEEPLLLRVHIEYLWTSTETAYLQAQAKTQKQYRSSSPSTTAKFSSLNDFPSNSIFDKF